MLDTLAIARQLTDAGLKPEQANAITDAVRQAAEHGDYVTREQQRADLASLRADIYRAMLIQTLATIGGTVAILRLLE